MNFETYRDYALSIEVLEAQETRRDITVSAYPTLQNGADKSKIIKDCEKKGAPFKKAISFAEFARKQNGQ